MVKFLTVVLFSLGTLLKNIQGFAVYLFQIVILSEKVNKLTETFSFFQNSTIGFKCWLHLESN